MIFSLRAMRRQRLNSLLDALLLQMMSLTDTHDRI